MQYLNFFPEFLICGRRAKDVRMHTQKQFQLLEKFQIISLLMAMEWGGRRYASTAKKATVAIGRRGRRGALTQR